MWSRRQESNLYFTLRRHAHYPLCYGEGRGILGAALRPSRRCKQRYLVSSRIASSSPLSVSGYMRCCISC